MTSSASGPNVLGPGEGASVQIGGALGVRFMIEAAATGNRFALVEHPIAPRSLAAPMHTHRHEDEYSYVLEGTVGVQLGSEVLEATPGDLVVKPRGVPHAFWNPGDTPARLLEIISPAGFEKYFDELAPLIPAGAPPDVEAIAALQARYGLEMDFDSRPVLIEQHGLVNSRA
jgi:quercetin dioxygenase-like cupin family protein